MIFLVDAHVVVQAKIGHSKKKKKTRKKEKEKKIKEKENIEKM